MQRVLYDAVSDVNSRFNDLLNASDRIEYGIRQLNVEGDELNARAVALQATSTLNLYFSELTQKEIRYRNQLRLGA